METVVLASNSAGNMSFNMSVVIEYILLSIMILGLVGSKFTPDTHPVTSAIVSPI